MQIDEDLVNCVGFIGEPTGSGFVAEGTCFFVRYDDEHEAFLYIVTARHLVRPIKFGKELLPGDGTVQLRISRKNGPPRVLKTVRNTWIPYPDRHIDICVRPFDLREEDPDNELNINMLIVTDPDNNLRALAGKRPRFSLLFSPEREQYFGPIRMGDWIFIPSLFPGHVGEKRNIPIARVGNIAAPPLEVVRVGSPTVPAYLIETKSLGGISGAPVFLHLQPYRARNLPTYMEIDGEKDRTVPYALIGVVLGIHSGQYPADFIQTDTSEAIIGKDADINAGISVVLPIRHVMDLIEGDELRNARKAAIAAIRKQSGYRPASVRSYPPEAEAAPETNPEENPAHREDFTALLGEAVKPKPKDGQT